MSLAGRPPRPVCGYWARSGSNGHGQGQVVQRPEGFGFIQAEQTNKDVFVHHSVIEGDGYKTLTDGENPSSTTGGERQGLKATRVAGWRRSRRHPGPYRVIRGEDRAQLGRSIFRPLFISLPPPQSPSLPLPPPLVSWPPPLRLLHRLGAPLLELGDRCGNARQVPRLLGSHAFPTRTSPPS